MKSWKGLKKKTRIYLVCLLLLLIASCNLETKTLPDFYQKQLSNVTKIEIVDGNTGYQKSITNPQTIDDFLNNIKDVKFIPDKNQEKRDGFNYSISLYQDGNKTFSFSLIQVNGNYYHTEPDILPIVDQFYKNLDNKYD
ncbi:hypothetical protein [Tenuibacillus multivorans]|uniref:Lipoprotein n=1 Tax=Tenuibacillus multivorans TaxID=237069 RepID=A0A1H0D1L8_9BACI|nr:hypothetical protein [Tenuibacillus multivorans]GEL76078.1 hypothetical protein TMU01_03130 [Tenuibacillus multivorans]SDN64063.1 hypothetical protein SAMN05216498_2758 [Tenuibacillus multivorans]